jgi:signal transduction histidine kinase
MRQPSSPPTSVAPAEAFQQQLARLRAEQDRLFEDLRGGEARLRHLARSVWRVEEEERRRIARDLHDGVGQNLSALRHRVEAVRVRASAAEDIASLDEAIALCDQALAETRSLVRLLRPQILDDLGLEAALRWLARSCEESTHAEVDVDVQVDEVQLGPELATLAFRVVQESLTNVTRHARAKHVSIRVAMRAGQLSVLVVDDGAGFDVAAGLAASSEGRSAGLSGMRERVSLFGGRFNLVSAPGDGTQVRAQVPLALQGAR